MGPGDRAALQPGAAGLPGHQLPECAAHRQRLSALRAHLRAQAAGPRAGRGGGRHGRGGERHHQGGPPQGHPQGTASPPARQPAHRLFLCISRM